MQCPAGCATALVMTDRSSVEIDYCPTCRGVWLDRGELDKLIERDAAYATAAARVDERRYDDRRDDRRDDRKHDDRRYGQQPRKKKSSFLQDLFEGMGE